jgi:glycerone phosphate O-acyltransferase
MKMKLVSGLLRQSGAFFMRRTFGADRLYKAVFTEYVKTVLCSNDAPLEFFIEGTRSRTAKTLHPKLGLLSMVVEPYLAGLVPDIMLVPVSISYQRTLEELLFSKELLGVPKPPESTQGLMKALSIIAEDYGSIFAEIGKPMSLHDFCMSRGVSRIPHTIYPKDKSVILPRERQVILELSHVILDHTHHGMWVFPTAMTAALLLQHSSGLERKDLASMLEWLKEQVLLRGSKVHWEGGTAQNLDFALKTLSSSLEMTSSLSDTIRVLSLVSNYPPGPRGHNIEEVMRLEVTEEDTQQVTDLTFSRLLLSHYRNQLFHLFVAEAMLALSVYHCLPCSRATAMKRFETLHCALAREFVLPLCTPQELFFSTLMTLIDRGFLTVPRGGDDITLNDERAVGFEFLKCLIQPFVEGVWVVCHHLVMFCGGVQSLTTTIKGAQHLAIKCVLTGVVESFDPLSLDVIRNTLASLTQLGLIHQPESEVEGRDRLVKVDKQDKLVQLASQLGAILGRPGTVTAKL